MDLKKKNTRVMCGPVSMGWSSCPVNYESFTIADLINFINKKDFFETEFL